MQHMADRNISHASLREKKRSQQAAIVPFHGCMDSIELNCGIVGLEVDQWNS